MTGENDQRRGCGRTRGTTEARAVTRAIYDFYERATKKTEAERRKDARTHIFGFFPHPFLARSGLSWPIRTRNTRMNVRLYMQRIEP